MLNYVKVLPNREAMYHEYFPRFSVGVEVGVLAGENAEVLLEVTRPRELQLIDSWCRDKGSPFAYLRALRLSKLPNVFIHKSESVEAARQFPDNYFDWAYIDAAHHYTAVRRDLQTYYRKVKPGGILAGHDYSRPLSMRPPFHRRRDRGFFSGVHQAVQELMYGHYGRCELLCFTGEHQRSFAFRVLG